MNNFVRTMRQQIVPIDQQLTAVASGKSQVKLWGHCLKLLSSEVVITFRIDSGDQTLHQEMHGIFLKQFRTR